MELAGVIVRALSNKHVEKAREIRELPMSSEKVLRKYQTHLQEGQEGGLGEVQAGQLHLGPCKGDGEILLQPCPDTWRTRRGLLNPCGRGKQGMLCTWTFARTWMWSPMVSLEQIADIWTEEVDDVVAGMLAGRSGTNAISGAKSFREPDTSSTPQ